MEKFLAVPSVKPLVKLLVKNLMVYDNITAFILDDIVIE